MKRLLRPIVSLSALATCLFCLVPAVQAAGPSLYGRSIILSGELVAVGCVPKCSKVKLKLGGDKFYIGKNGTDIYSYDAVNSGTIVKPRTWKSKGNTFTKIKVQGNVMNLYGKIKFASITDFRITFVTGQNSCKVKVQTKRGQKVADTSFNRKEFTCRVADGNIFAQ